MTIRDIFISFGYDVDKKSEDKANSSIEKLKSLADSALGAIKIAFSIAGISKLAEVAANAEALRSQFTSVFKELESEAAQALNNIANDTGVVANRMKGSFTQMAAFAKTTGMSTSESLNLSERALRAVADGAAFYDKSIESMTESLTSFLKGNMQADSSLGLSATETTRNAAANELYGMSYIKLSEAQKQLTLLKMVEDANMLSGAFGQAARESDTWTNQLGNMKQAINDLMAVTGSAFLEPAIQVLKFVTALVITLTDAISDLTSEGRFLNRMFARITNGLKRAQTMFERFVIKIGGAEQALKLLGIVAGAFGAVVAGARIMAAVEIFRTMDKALLAAKAKLVGIVAIVLILALLIEDFIGFMQGKDSLFGELLKSASFDLEEVRDKVRNIWTNIQAVLSTIWNAILNLGRTVFGALARFWDAWGADITKMLGTVFVGLIDIVDGVFSGDWQKIFKK